MKYGPFTAIMLACLLFFAAPAEARHRRAIEPASGWGWGSSQVVTSTHAAHRYAGNLPSPCYEAARKGGPCGCWASIHFFGHSVRELWLARNWLRFPRTVAHAGAAAVWPGRHVAPVVGVPRPGYVTVADSWQTHDVRTAGLVFVDPRY